MKHIFIVDCDLAVKHGLNSVIVYDYIERFPLGTSKTLNNISLALPFLSKRQITGCLKKLCSSGLLKFTQLDSMNRTKYYSVNEV